MKALVSMLIAGLAATACSQSAKKSTTPAAAEETPYASDLNPVTNTKTSTKKETSSSSDTSTSTSDCTSTSTSVDADFLDEDAESEEADSTSLKLADCSSIVTESGDDTLGEDGETDTSSSTDTVAEPDRRALAKARIAERLKKRQAMKEKIQSERAAKKQALLAKRSQIKQKMLAQKQAKLEKKAEQQTAKQAAQAERLKQRQEKLAKAKEKMTALGGKRGGGIRSPRVTAIATTADGGEAAAPVAKPWSAPKAAAGQRNAPGAGAKNPGKK